jgi:hypothetical protein
MPARKQPRRFRFHPLSIGVAQAIPLLIALQFYSGEAAAACTPAAPTDGATVSCSGVPILLPPNPNSFLSNANNLDVTVPAGAIMSTLPGGAAMSFGGNGPTLDRQGQGARPMSKTKRVASRGTGSKATKRRPATRLAAATPRSAPPSGAVTQPQTWCDEASARTQ